MKMKTLDYIGIGVVFLLLTGSLFAVLGFSSSEEIIIKEDLNLEQYRSEEIPKDCRLPIYENRIESWKQHLSHHEDSLDCLKYFK